MRCRGCRNWQVCVRGWLVGGLTGLERAGMYVGRNDGHKDSRQGVDKMEGAKSSPSENVSGIATNARHKKRKHVRIQKKDYTTKDPDARDERGEGWGL